MAIRSFRCADTEALFGLVRVARLAGVERPALRKLKQIDLARIKEVMVRPVIVDGRNLYEAQRMVAEKVSAAMAAQTELALGAMSGSPHAGATKAMALYRRRVRANRRRLAREV